MKHYKELNCLTDSRASVEFSLTGGCLLRIGNGGFGRSHGACEVEGGDVGLGQQATLQQMTSTSIPCTYVYIQPSWRRLNMIFE